VLYAILRSKIHRARVTEAQLDYQGSLSLDARLMAAADLKEHDWVQITSMANGTRWQTYVLAAPAGSGTVRANGAAARHFAPGDEVIILAFGYVTAEERAHVAPRLVHVDGDNRPVVPTGDA
jgi:aspartate 1-decarboxylase